MKFTFKKIAKKEFYPIYHELCVKHDFPVVTDLWLPESAFICYTDKGDIAYCIWGWHTNSKLFWIGFPASNLDIDFKDREFGLDYLLNEVSKYAKRKKYITVFTTSGTESIINSLDKNGFVLGDINIKHFFKIL